MDPYQSLLNDRTPVSPETLEEHENTTTEPQLSLHPLHRNNPLLPSSYFVIESEQLAFEKSGMKPAFGLVASGLLASLGHAASLVRLSDQRVLTGKFAVGVQTETTEPTEGPREA